MKDSDCNGSGSNGVEVERMQWFNLLLLYGSSGADEPKQLKEDPDRNLMSNLIERVVLIKLKGKWNSTCSCSYWPLLGWAGRCGI